MSTKRSITLVCDRCSAEYGPMSWISKAGCDAVTMQTLLKMATGYGWRIVHAAGSERGGSKRFDFCPERECQTAAANVPQRLSELWKAEQALVKAKARVERAKKGKA